MAQVSAECVAGKEEDGQIHKEYRQRKCLEMRASEMEPEEKAEDKAKETRVWEVKERGRHVHDGECCEEVR